MATFPSYACVLLEGYEESPDFGVLRSEMDNSIAKQRPRRSLPIVTRTVRIKVENKTDKVSFDEWFKDDLNGGSGFFSYLDPLDNETKQGRFVNGELRWSSPGIIWIADAQIETIG
jgi:hypothetical protein